MLAHKVGLWLHQLIAIVVDHGLWILIHSWCQTVLNKNIILIINDLQSAAAAVTLLLSGEGVIAEWVDVSEVFLVLVVVDVVVAGCCLLGLLLIPWLTEIAMWLLGHLVRIVGFL